MKHARLYLLSLVLLSGACQADATSPQGEISAPTDSEAYAADESIIVTLRNATTASVAFSHCNHRIGFTVEELRGGAWVEVMGVNTICPAIYLSGTTVLEAGSVHSETIALSGSGAFRLKYEVVAPAQDGDGVVVLSNTFVLD